MARIFFRDEIGLTTMQTSVVLNCSSMTGAVADEPAEPQNPLISGGSAPSVRIGSIAAGPESAASRQSVRAGRGARKAAAPDDVIEIGQGDGQRRGSVPGRLAQPNISAMSLIGRHRRRLPLHNSCITGRAR